MLEFFIDYLLDKDYFYYQNTYYQFYFPGPLSDRMRSNLNDLLLTSSRLPPKSWKFGAEVQVDCKGGVGKKDGSRCKAANVSPILIRK